MAQTVLIAVPLVLAAAAAIWSSYSARTQQRDVKEMSRSIGAIVHIAMHAVAEARSRASEAEGSARTAQQVATSLQERAEKAERASHAAEEAAEHAQRRQEELERVAAIAVEARRRAEEARLTIERKRFEGVRPECHPSEEDIGWMKARYDYRSEFFHLAVVGSAGSGKSSFINAVRGLFDTDPLSARVGIVETTNTVTRYVDPRPDSRMIWYDIPGAGTQTVREWQYFNDMGLYIFDCIIVLVDNRVLDSDLAILSACEQFRNIEAFIVRSKSDQHINNMAHERMSPYFDLYDPDMDDETRSRFLQTKSEERKRFIDETCQSMQMQLQRKKLPPKRVYVVCKDAMREIIRNSHSKKAIDEVELLNDIRGGFVWKHLQSGCYN